MCVHARTQKHTSQRAWDMMVRYWLLNMPCHDSYHFTSSCFSVFTSSLYIFILVQPAMCSSCAASPALTSGQPGHCYCLLFLFSILWAEGRMGHLWKKAELNYPWGTTLICTHTLQPGFGVGTYSRCSSSAASCGGDTNWCLRLHPLKINLLFLDEDRWQLSWKSMERILFSVSCSNVMIRARPWTWQC